MPEVRTAPACMAGVRPTQGFWLLGLDALITHFRVDIVDYTLRFDESLEI